MQSGVIPPITLNRAAQDDQRLLNSAHLAEAYDRYVAIGIQRLGYLLAALEMTVAIIKLLLLPLEQAWLLVPLTVAAGLAIGLTTYIARNRPLSLRWSHPIAVFFTALFFINGMLYLWQTEQLLAAIYLAINIVAIGFFILSPKWYWSTLTLIHAGWWLFYFTIFLSQQAQSALQMWHYAIAMCVASLLSIATRGNIGALVQRTTTLHLRDEAQAQALHRALTAVQQSEAHLLSSKQQLEGALQQTQALYQVSQSLVAVGDLSDVLRRSIEGIAAALSACQVAIYLLDLANHQVVQVVNNKAAEGLSEVSFDTLMNDLSGWVIDKRRAALSSKSNLDLRQSAEAQAKRRQLGLGSLAVAPILYHDEILGTLCAARRATAPDFNERELEIVVTLSSQVAAAVANARLLDQMRHQSDELRRVMENAAAPIFGIASSGHVTEWNAAMQALTGAASEKALQRSFVSEFIPEHAQPIIQGHIDNVLQGWMVDKFECPIRDAQGKIHLVLMSCTARRNASDEITGAINIGQDITDRQLAERELQRINELLEQGVAERTQEITVANQKLQHELAERLRIEEELRRSEEQLVLRVEERTAELSAANTELSRVARLKDEFLASMSHELRTPLSGIMGLSEALKEEIYGPLNERQRRSVDVVIESSRHLLTLINDILDISKIGAGKFELVYEWFMIESVIRSSLDLIRTAAQKKHIEINFRKDVHVSKIYADERRLKQILFNLLMNAVKFTPDGGKIGLEVLADSEQGTIRFAVWDTGIGISKKDMGRLFQPFVQLDSGLARQHPGTGLGLALVYRMTRMMGGSVSVESELHHGSRFTVALPWREYTHGADAAADKELAVQTGASVTKPNAKQRAGLVLIAEDNQATLDAFSDYLASLGYRTVTVHTGIEIVTTSKELLPSAILMEIKTPKLNGLEAIRQVRSDPATAHIPIIVVTTMAMPGESERCMTAGATAYLSKPVSIHTIISVLETNIERNRQAEGG